MGTQEGGPGGVNVTRQSVTLSADQIPPQHFPSAGAQPGELLHKIAHRLLSGHESTGFGSLGWTVNRHTSHNNTTEHAHRHPRRDELSRPEPRWLSRNLFFPGVCFVVEPPTWGHISQPDKELPASGIRSMEASSKWPENDQEVPRSAGCLGAAVYRACGCKLQHPGPSFAKLTGRWAGPISAPHACPRACPRIPAASPPPASRTFSSCPPTPPSPRGGTVSLTRSGAPSTNLTTVFGPLFQTFQTR